MLKMLKEIASDSIEIAAHSFRQYKMKGSGKAAVAARQRYEAEKILQDAKEKALAEEKILLETRDKALRELAELQGRAFAKGLNPLNTDFSEEHQTEKGDIDVKIKK
jgi:hypothetical protein